jgi:folate-dependent phosphoribosylglycinamide formyltransferase PurN
MHRLLFLSLVVAHALATDEDFQCDVKPAKRRQIEHLAFSSLKDDGFELVTLGGYMNKVSRLVCTHHQATVMSVAAGGGFRCARERIGAF